MGSVTCNGQHTYRIGVVVGPGSLMDALSVEDETPMPVTSSLVTGCVRSLSSGAGSARSSASLGRATLGGRGSVKDVEALVKSTFGRIGSVREVDRPRSRIVLVGTPSYTIPSCPMYRRSATIWSIWPRCSPIRISGDKCRTLRARHARSSVGEVGDVLVRAASEAEDLLLFYYSGYGKIARCRSCTSLCRHRHDRLR